MGKSSGSAPAAPDPAIVAAAQGAEDRKTLQYTLNNSRTSTVNPFGTTSWANNRTFDQAGFDAAMAAYKPKITTSGGGIYDDQSNTISAPVTTVDNSGQPDREQFYKDNWTNTQTLSPESQGIYDTATSKLADATGRISTDADAYNQTVADAIYNRMRRYTEPAEQQARSSMQSNLADRGFQVGNEGYNTEMDRLDNTQNLARLDAADRSTIAGMTEGRAQLSMQQQIAQMLQGLRGAQVAGVSGMPTTTQTPNMQSPDIAGLTMEKYKSDLDAYNAEQASSDGVFGSLLSLGGMALGGPLGAGLAGKLFGGGSNPYAAGGYVGSGLKVPRGVYG